MPTLPADAHIVPQIPLPAWPIDIVRGLCDRPIWLAGGPVRDLIIDRIPQDWDFVSDGGAMQLARAVANAMDGAFYPLDTTRGTGRAIVQDPNTHTAITLDFAELRGSHILEDLQRRDFTINAIAATLDGYLIDPTAGRQDLVCGCIRMTSPCAFRQDPARLVRAVRQAVQLHFVLEPKTSRQIRCDAAAVNDVAVERIRAELVKLLRLPDASLGLQQLDELSLLKHLLPEFHAGHTASVALGGSAHDTADTGKHLPMGRLIDTVDRLATAAGGLATAAGSVQSAPKTPPQCEISSRAGSDIACMLSDLAQPLLTYLDEPVRCEVTRRDLLKWCALFLDTGLVERDAVAATTLTALRCGASARVAEQAMIRLRFSRAAVELAVRAIGACWRFGQLLGATPSRRQIYTYYREAGSTGPITIILSLANTVVHHSTVIGTREWHEQLDLARVLLDAYFRQREVLVDPQPLLSGKDLMALGLDAGPRMGELIEALREAQAAGDVSTRSEAQAWADRMIAAQ